MSNKSKLNVIRRDITITKHKIGVLSREKKYLEVLSSKYKSRDFEALCQYVRVVRPQLNHELNKYKQTLFELETQAVDIEVQNENWIPEDEGRIEHYIMYGDEEHVRIVGQSINPFPLQQEKNELAQVLTGVTIDSFVRLTSIWELMAQFCNGDIERKQAYKTISSGLIYLSNQLSVLVEREDELKMTEIDLEIAVEADDLLESWAEDENFNWD